MKMTGKGSILLLMLLLVGCITPHKEILNRHEFMLDYLNYTDEFYKCMYEYRFCILERTDKLTCERQQELCVIAATNQFKGIRRAKGK